MIIGETILIVLYMINSNLAFAFSLLFFGYYLFQKNTSKYETLFNLLILSTPLFSISILGANLHHMFSWIYIFLLIYLILLVRDLAKGKYCLKKNFLLIIIFLIILFVQSIIGNFVLSNIMEFIQITIMILPIALTYYAKDYIKTLLPKDFSSKFVNSIGNVIFATALAVIIQCGLYTYKGIMIGNINFFAQRIVFDAVFSGFSILSIFLGVGVVIYMYQLLKYKKFNSLFKLAVIAVALFFNSSRTGIVASALAIGLWIIKNSFSKGKINFKNLMFLLIFVIASFFLLYQLFMVRGDDSIFAGSGRIEGYHQAWDFTISSPIYFLFGNGLAASNYNFTLPHNFILQTLMCSGIFMLVYSLIFVYKLIKVTSDDIFKYIIIAILIGGLLTTDFYANTFFTVFAVIGLICNSLNGGEKNEEKSNCSSSGL